MATSVWLNIRFKLELPNSGTKWREQFPGRLWKRSPAIQPRHPTNLPDPPCPPQKNEVPKKLAKYARITLKQGHVLLSRTSFLQHPWNSKIWFGSNKSNVLFGSKNGIYEKWMHDSNDLQVLTQPIIIALFVRPLHPQNLTRKQHTLYSIFRRLAANKRTIISCLDSHSSSLRV